MQYLGCKNWSKHERSGFKLVFKIIFIMLLAENYNDSFEFVLITYVNHWLPVTNVGRTQNVM